MKSILIRILSLFLIFSISAVTAVEIREERVQFKPGETGATIKGRIKGRQIVDYRLSVKAGQSMAVILETSNRFNYFNITEPDADSAMFIGSISGNRFVGSLSKGGEYIVRVYLMPNAERRGETAKYTINFALSVDNQSTKSATSSETGPEKFDAYGEIKCSADKQTLDQWCEFRVLRDLPKHSAEIWITNITFKDQVHYRVLYFADGKFSTNEKAKLAWQRQDDNWWVSIGGREFYFIPDALIYGG
jgi:hypothetical protein